MASQSTWWRAGTFVAAVSVPFVPLGRGTNSASNAKEDGIPSEKSHSAAERIPATVSRQATKSLFIVKAADNAIEDIIAESHFGFLHMMRKFVYNSRID